MYGLILHSSCLLYTSEEKELTGTIDDIKDFMFVVTDDKDRPYSLDFDVMCIRDSS